MGPTQDSWITIILYFEYTDIIEDTLVELSSNLDALAGLIDGMPSGWGKSTCEKYCGFAREDVDTMIANFLNDDPIAAPEDFCVLRTRFIVIDLVAGDPDITALCDTIMDLIDELENFLLICT